MKVLSRYWTAPLKSPFSGWGIAFRYAKNKSIYYNSLPMVIYTLIKGNERGVSYNQYNVYVIHDNILKILMCLKLL